MQPYHTEQELAAALARREEAAAEQLVREYGGLLNAVVRRHSGRRPAGHLAKRGAV